MDRPILELHNITKAFGDTVANDDISLDVRSGEVLALVGENGAGKTTLMTMIAGTAQPDSGHIVFDGDEVVIDDPITAQDLGIGMVHQHFMLVPSLTVAANVFLGREILTSNRSLDTAAMEARVRELSEHFGLEIEPTDLIEDLSVGERQRVEIIKALSHDTRVLILDEPTAVLTPAEAQDLFVVIRRLVSEGAAVVFISHKLGEVLAIADTVTVIRDGTVIGTRSASGLSEPEVASMMVGREVLLRIDHTPAEPGAEMLSIHNLYALDTREAIAVEDLSFSVHSGEIVGIAGVQGNGQSELADAIAGMNPPPRGTITIDGEDVTTMSVAGRRGIGMAYIPEDRYGEGTGPGMPVADNIAATHLEAPLVSHGWLNAGPIRRFASGLIDKFDVRGARPDTTVSTLSGGNMQKVVIGREFASAPTLLMVSQPTRGVDVGAMEFVHNSIVQARDEGAAVLLISADLNEVMALSDRLLVMYRGQIVAEFTQETMSEVAVGLAMAGVEPSDDALSEAEQHQREVGDLVATKRDAAAATPPQTDVADKAATASQGDADVERVTGSATTSFAELAGTEDRHGGFSLAEAARRFVTGSVQPLVSIALALIIGAVVILAIGENPWNAYVELFTSAWRTPFGISSVIAFFIPLAIMSAAVIISFRAGFFNIGGEGQLYVGAFFGAWAGFTFTSLPGWMTAILALLCGVIAGAIWGLIPGALLAFWKVDIIVTTLLFSSIAILFTQYLVSGPFKDPTTGMLASEKIEPSARFTMFNVSYGIGPDLIIGIVVAILIGLLLVKTTWGLKVRELGELNRFAQYAGASPKAMSMQVMLVSGGAAGFAGALYVLGPNGGRFLQNFSPGYGFLAITVALLARLNPWASMIAALFYATMMAGSTGLQSTGVPFPLVNVLQGLIIIFITAQLILKPRRKVKSVGGPPGEVAVSPMTLDDTDEEEAA